MATTSAAPCRPTRCLVLCRQHPARLSLQCEKTHPGSRPTRPEAPAPIGSASQKVACDTPAESANLTSDSDNAVSVSDALHRNSGPQLFVRRGRVERKTKDQIPVKTLKPVKMLCVH